MQTQATPTADLVQPTLKVHQIVSGMNYRKNYDPSAMAELKAQIVAAGGVESPILVRPHPVEDGMWQIIAGERRWRCASDLYGPDYDMPVRVREATDAEARALGIIENHGRDNPSPIEEAQGAADLLAFNAGNRDITAQQLGWEPKVLESRLLLLNCAADVQQAIIDRHPHLKIGHAELLAGLPQEQQSKALRMILDHRVPVAELRKQIGGFARKLADAVFDTAVCRGCQHNSALQAGLFSEALGDGHCQNPGHYEELTMQALEAKAAPLRERFQVVRFVKPGDGFQSLSVAADGPVGVGAEQMEACRGCASFGCSLSAIPGRYGEVEEALCFDAACHGTKVAARRKAERAASSASKAEATGAKRNSAQVPTGTAQVDAGKPKNQVPGKVVTFRVEQWRKWLANALMTNGARNHKALVGLVLAREVRAVTADKFADAAQKLTGAKVGQLGETQLRKCLEAADGFAFEHVDKLVLAVAASAAYGIDVEGLEAMLNYLEVDESKHFTLNDAYLSLLTVSELESLADEVGLRKAMGEAYSKAKAGKRADFIQALLGVNGFTYAGAVPKAMRYAKRKFKFTAPSASDNEAPGAGGSATHEAPGAA